jgi:hypothetical protein
VYAGATIEQAVKSAKPSKTKPKPVSFSFKLSFDFRQKFKLQALMRNMTMTELLVVAIESYIEAPTESQRLSIKKSGNDYL